MSANPFYKLVPGHSVSAKIRRAAANRLGAILRDEKLPVDQWEKWMDDHPDDMDVKILRAPISDDEPGPAEIKLLCSPGAVKQADRREALKDRRQEKISNKLDAKQRLVSRFPNFSTQQLADWVRDNPKDADVVSMLGAT